jgi:hypothetical protein
MLVAERCYERRMFAASSLSDEIDGLTRPSFVDSVAAR